MRTRRSIVLLALIVTVAAGVAAQTPDQKALAGRWEGQRQSESRMDNIALSFEVSAKGVSGTAFLNGQEFDTLTGIVVHGHDVAFDMGNMSFTGVIDEKAHTMSVTAHFDGRDLWQMTVTRKDQV